MTMNKSNINEIIPLDQYIRNLENSLIDLEWSAVDTADYDLEIERLRQRILSAKMAESYGEQWHVPW